LPQGHDIAEPLADAVKRERAVSRLPLFRVLHAEGRTAYHRATRLGPRAAIRFMAPSVQHIAKDADQG
jgi:hypothetical protein